MKPKAIGIVLIVQTYIFLEFSRQEIERAVSADDAEFTSQAKISPDEALKTALAVHSGVLLNIEYEIEPDAVTGETDPAEKVLYQIGGD